MTSLNCLFATSYCSSKILSAECRLVPLVFAAFFIEGRLESELTKNYAGHCQRRLKLIVPTRRCVVLPEVIVRIYA